MDMSGPLGWRARIGRHLGAPVLIRADRCVGRRLWGAAPPPAGGRGPRLSRDSPALVGAGRARPTWLLGPSRAPSPSAEMTGASRQPSACQIRHNIRQSQIITIRRASSPLAPGCIIVGRRRGRPVRRWRPFEPVSGALGRLINAHHICGRGPARPIGCMGA